MVAYNLHLNPQQLILYKDDRINALLFIFLNLRLRITYDFNLENGDLWLMIIISPFGLLKIHCHILHFVLLLILNCSIILINQLLIFHSNLIEDPSDSYDYQYSSWHINGRLINVILVDCIIIPPILFTHNIFIKQVSDAIIIITIITIIIIVIIIKVAKPYNLLSNYLISSCACIDELLVLLLCFFPRNFVLIIQGFTQTSFHSTLFLYLRIFFHDKKGKI